MTLFQADTSDDQVVYVDAENPSIANWLRYVNCARHISEENVAVGRCDGHVYYRTTVDIAPYTELLVYYGNAYAKWLGVDTDMYYDRTVSPAFDLAAERRFS